MITKKTIHDIIEKCLTKARIREKLEAYNNVEKVKLMEGLTNYFELEDYQNQVDRLYHLKKIREARLEEIKYGDDSSQTKFKLNKVNQTITEVEESIFQYERRIIQGYTPPIREVPNVDVKKFKDARDSEIDEAWTDEEYGMVREQMTMLESNQIEAQDKVMRYSVKSLESLEEWFDEGHIDINDSIYKNKKWEYLSDEEKRMKQEKLIPVKRNITRMINESPGLIEDTVLYMGSSHFDVSKVVGDHMNFKGYLSTSFKEEVAVDFMEQFEEGDVTFLYKILAPKGTKGICGESTRVSNPNRFEHEYVLGRDTGATILDIDYDSHIVTIVLDEP